MILLQSIAKIITGMIDFEDLSYHENNAVITLINFVKETDIFLCKSKFFPRSFFVDYVIPHILLCCRTHSPIYSKKLKLTYSELPRKCSKYNIYKPLYKQ